MPVALLGSFQKLFVIVTNSWPRSHAESDLENTIQNMNFKLKARVLKESGTVTINSVDAFLDS
jgi:hypothetical protein